MSNCPSCVRSTINQLKKLIESYEWIPFTT
jgi:hypothetical protein